MSRRGNAVAFAAAFGALALVLFALNGHNAYHPTDDGFVLAYSWRVLNGEVPYRDFLYIRTPLSPYLHVLELVLPDGWAIPAGRLVFYLEMAVAGALPTMWAAVRLGRTATARALALCTIFFMFAVHNFPPMPWPTVDAVLFASASVTALLFSLDATPRRAILLRAAASVLVALSVLAKQTFAPLSLLLVGLAFVEAVRGGSRRLFVGTVIPGALVAAVTGLLLVGTGALPDFVQQLSEPTRLRPSVAVPWSGDLVADGIIPYARAFDPIVLVFMAGGFALGRSRGAGLPGRAAATVVVAALAALGIEARFDMFTAGRQLLLILIAVLISDLWSQDHAERQAVVALGALVAVAWCASLSFAYQTPLLGLAAAGIFVERALSRVLWPAGWLAIGLAAAVVITSMLELEIDRPYRDVPRADQVADLGDIYPRFGHLLTNAQNAERFRELRELSTRYAPSDGAFVVIPDYPLIHYLSGSRTPVSIDWVQPQEYLGQADRIAAELAARRPIVIIEREPSTTVGTATQPPSPCTAPPDPQELVARIVRTWTLVVEGSHFCVYQASQGAIAR